MSSYRDTWEFRLYEALAAVMEGAMRCDEVIPEKDKEHAKKIMDEWASEQTRKNTEKMEERINDCTNKSNQAS